MLIDKLRKELTLKEVIKYSRNLTDIVQDEFSPDIVISIGNGGILPGFEIANQLQSPYEIISIKRNINLQELYKKTPDFLISFVKLYQGYLFLTSKPKLKKGIDYNISGKSILLVDDTIHTGKTLNVAKEYLQRQCPREIKIASINYINKTIPDFFIMKGRCKFPWSKNSNEYSSFKDYIHKNNFVLSSNF